MVVRLHRALHKSFRDFESAVDACYANFVGEGAPKFLTNANVMLLLPPIKIKGSLSSPGKGTNGVWRDQTETASFRAAG
jgi:hypothetical protein